MGLDKKHFGGGMNSDDEDRLLAPGDYRYALNVRAGITNGENNGAIENSKGTQLVDVTLPSGVNEVIGTYEDKNTNRVYYFLWNSFNQHGVYCFDIEKKKVYILASENSNTDNALNFSRNFLITGIDVVDDGDRQLLYWTDNFNPPRKLNITRALSGKSANGEYGDLGYLNPDYTNLIKAAPSFPPAVAYADDSTVSTNLLYGKLFQFKYKYVYLDDEHSAWSPISIPPIPNTEGDKYQSIQNRINVIVKAPVDSTGKEIARVVIAAREGNNGDFFQIYDEDVTFNSTNILQVPFYNDGVYNSVDLAESNKLFDNVPKKAQALSIIDGNRLALGNIVEGFDPVDVKLTKGKEFSNPNNITFNETDDSVFSTPDAPKTFKIKGSILIINPYVAAETGGAAAYQPIWKDGSKDQVVFGGVGPFAAGKIDPNTNVIAINPNMELKKQVFKEKSNPGFPVYLAGTKYFDRTKQFATTITRKGAVTSEVGPLQFNSTGNTGKKRSDAGKILNTIYSQEFEIKGVKEGKYILRVGRHDVTDNELNGQNLDWQKRSTNVYYMKHNGGGSPSIVSVSPTEIVFNMKGNVDDLLIYVMDLSVPRDFRNAPATNAEEAANTVTGYLLDDVDNQLDSDINSIKGLTGVHKSQIDFGSQKKDEFKTSSDSSYAMYQGQIKGWNFGQARTDHNGYFFFTTQKLKIQKESTTIKVGKQKFQSGAIDFQEDIGGSLASINTPINKETILGYFGVKVANGNKNIIRGSVIDTDGRGREGVTVLANEAYADVTDSSGEYDLTLYPESSSNTYYGNIYYNYSDLALLGTIDNDSKSVRFTGAHPSDDIGSDGNISDVTFTLIKGSSSVTRGFKRGGRYQLGMVYYDKYNRSGTVQTNDTFKLNIPFYYRGKAAGAPIVNWSIDHDPPSWATHFQWVRTKNLAVSSYLQMVVGSVRYLNNQNEVVSDRASASFIILNMNSIVDYAKSSGSSVSYSFAKGDRVRFIKNASGKYYKAPTSDSEDLIDLPIINTYVNSSGVRGPLSLIIPENRDMPDDIEEGMLVELYTPAPIITDDEDFLFYEFGEVYEIDGGKHKVTSGTFTDGDVYYRPRIMPTGGRVYGSFVDDFNFSDLYESRVDNIGRPNKVDRDYKETRRPTTIFYSEKFIPETNINGLSNFFSLSFETYERKYGVIQKLFAQDNDLDVYQERKVGKVLVNKNVLVGLDGQTNVTSSTSVLSQIIYYKGDFGIGDHPESFAEYGGKKYFVDIYRGAVLRLGGDGITVISDYKMNNYFTTRHGLLAKSKYKVNIWGAYNKDFESYFISYQGLNERSIDYFIGNEDALNKEIEVSDSLRSQGDRRDDAIESGGSSINEISDATRDEVFKSGDFTPNSDIVSADTNIREEDAFGGNVSKDVVKNRFEKDLQNKIQGESIISSTKQAELTGSMKISNDSLTPPPPQDRASDLEALRDLDSSTLSRLRESNPESSKTLDEMIKRLESFNEPVGSFDSDVSLSSTGSGDYDVNARPVEELDNAYVSYAVTDETTGQYVVVIAEEPVDNPTELPIDSAIIVEGTTVAFCEATKRWTSFYSWTADGMSSMGMNICSFNKGRLYVHNRTERYNNFHGNQYDSEMHVIFNINPSDVKVFQAISLESNDVWVSDDITTPEGQKTSISLEDFQSEDDAFVVDNKEGVYYAALWRDENTPNVDDPLFNGDMMRSKSLKVKLKNENTTELVKILMANVKFIKSNRSNG